MENLDLSLFVSRMLRCWSSSIMLIVGWLSGGDSSSLMLGVPWKGNSAHKQGWHVHCLTFCKEFVLTKFFFRHLACKEFLHIEQQNWVEFFLTVFWQIVQVTGPGLVSMSPLSVILNVAKWFWYNNMGAVYLLLCCLTAENKYFFSVFWFLFSA